MTPISVQLYSLRDACADDFDAVLGRLAQIGFKGVEPFHLFGKSARELRTQVEDLGMRISSSHTPWANRSEPQAVIDTLGELGLDRAIGGFMPDDFKDMAAIEKSAETTNTLLRRLKQAGIELALHNHWWEFELIDGEPGYHHFQKMVPDVLFEIDTYWAANFGACDPAVEVARVRERTPLLHIKDGPLQRDAANLVLGTGAMDIPDVIAAADPEVLEWLVIEFDKCDSDMMTAVEDSYRYMTENALGVGNV